MWVFYKQQQLYIMAVESGAVEESRQLVLRVSTTGSTNHVFPNKRFTHQSEFLHVYFSNLQFNEYLIILCEEEQFWEQGLRGPQSSVHCNLVLGTPSWQMEERFKEGMQPVLPVLWVTVSLTKLLRRRGCSSKDIHQNKTRHLISYFELLPCGISVSNAYRAQPEQVSLPQMDTLLSLSLLCFV